jgi:CBS domain-containing protein
MPLENQQIQDLLSPVPCVSVTPDAVVSQAVALMSEEHLSSTMVVEDEVLVGIFTERDFLNRVAAAGLSPAATLIRDVMTASPHALQATDSVGAAIDLMAFRGFRNVPIVDDARRPVGVLRVREVIAHLAFQLRRVDSSEESTFDSVSRAALQDLGKVPVDQLAKGKGEPARVRHTDPIRDALEIMRDRHVGAVVVENSEADICGIFTERDVIVRLAREELNLEAAVMTVMTPDPIRVLTSFTVSAALSCMHAGRFRHLPLADDNGRAGGMISISDILGLVASRSERIAAP